MRMKGMPIATAGTVLARRTVCGGIGRLLGIHRLLPSRERETPEQQFMAVQNPRTAPQKGKIKSAETESSSMENRDSLLMRRKTEKTHQTSPKKKKRVEGKYHLLPTAVKEEKRV